MGGRDRAAHGVGVAQVTVDDERIARVGPPDLAVILGVQRDTEAQAEQSLDRLLGYRVFPDAQAWVRKKRAY